MTAIAARAAGRAIGRLERTKIIDVCSWFLQKTGQRTGGRRHRPEGKKAQCINGRAPHFQGLAKQMHVDRIKQREENRLGNTADDK
ncbi:MAG: hypothetical protein WCK07_22685 [Betaproteobacteria bacterium]